MSQTLQEADNFAPWQDFGAFGKFQWFVFSLALFAAFSSGLVVLAPIFTSSTNRYRCKIPACDNGTNPIYNEDFLNFTTPWNDDLDKWNQCSFFASTNDDSDLCSPESFNQRALIQCHEWVYDRTMFKRTIVTDFSLTCNKSWLLPLSSSFYLLGLLIGSIFSGYVSDRFGRRAGVFVAGAILFSGVVIGSFSVSYGMYLATRLATGIGAHGCFQVSFLMAIEFISPRHRAATGILVTVGFAFGELFFGLIAYFIRDWRYMQLAVATPILLLPTYYWLMPESIKWLISMGREEEAQKYLRKAFKMNKLPLKKFFLKKHELDGEMAEQRTASEPISLRALAKSKTIIRRTFILSYLWVSSSVVYYGISLYSTSLSGNLFLNYAAIVLIEIPSYIISALLIDRVGRKGWHLFLYTLAGVACIVVPLIPSDQELLIVILNLVGKFGSSGSFMGNFLFTGELYPTSYRSLGIGICSFSARVGTLVSPFISNLSSIYPPLPAIIFGIMCLFAGFLTLLLPETLNTSLPQTISEAEQLGRDQKLCTLHCCMQLKSNGSN